MDATVEMRSDEPVAEINTTPLIDVMLVLLIMFIITIPLPTHSVPIDLPGGNPPPDAVRADRNRLTIEPDGALLWNGGAVDLATLRQYLELSARAQPVPELQLLPHAEARYERVDEVLATIRRSNVIAMGFVGNERYADF